eukprot:s2232_g3.t1
MIAESSAGRSRQAQPLLSQTADAKLGKPGAESSSASLPSGFGAPSLLAVPAGPLATPECRWSQGIVSVEGPYINVLSLSKESIGWLPFHLGDSMGLRACAESAFTVEIIVVNIVPSALNGQKVVDAQGDDSEGMFEIRHREIMTRLDDLFRQQERLLQGSAAERSHPKLDLSSQGNKPADNNPRAEKAQNRPQSHHPPETKVQQFVHSWGFEAFFAVVIVSNTVVLGVQTAWMAEHFVHGVPAVFTVLQVTYASLFFVEVVLRLWADGITTFFCSRPLDIFVVVSSVFELVYSAMAGFQTNPASTTALRLVLRFIRALRILIFSIMQTLKSLLWSLVLLFVIIYAFAVLFTDAAVTYQYMNGERLVQKDVWLIDWLDEHFC